ncbi:Transcription factor 25 [Porphyridium purpureum]|uniref:Transcription factor 25 n=1 Tax=Porphyridium purpureum TaxID=35688 RepID=A0A5J4YTD9_PORPP|nr:Transcription factor 25 [Porphyridium purpureum]|eukprot:POR2423..scf229_5
MRACRAGHVDACVGGSSGGEASGRVRSVEKRLVVELCEAGAMSRRAIRALEESRRAASLVRESDAAVAGGTTPHLASSDAHAGEQVHALLQSPPASAAGSSCDDDCARPRTSMFDVLAQGEDDSNEEGEEHDAEGSVRCREASGKDADQETFHSAVPQAASLSSPAGRGTKQASKKKSKKTKARKKPNRTGGSLDDLDALASMIEEATPSAHTHASVNGLSLIDASMDDYHLYMSKREAADHEFVAEVQRLYRDMYTAVFPSAASSQPQESGAGGALTPAEERIHFLRVDPPKLSCDYELKRIFGAQAVHAVRAQNTADDSAAQMRLQQGRARGSGRRRGGGRVGSLFFNPRETWPRAAPGLSMVLDTDAKDRTGQLSYFRYDRGGAYKQVHQTYLQVVRAHDPNELVHLISRFPTHIESLLQLSEVYRQMGELDRAAEFVERALYVLEGCWPISFKPFQGSCRLRYEVQENRALFVALFRNHQLVSRRGLNHTALEVTKLLWNLDPVRDPMGCALFLDTYALLSQELMTLIDVYTKFSPIRLDLIPSFRLSCALALHRSKVLEGKIASVSSAEAFAVETLLAFPMMLHPLLNTLAPDHERTRALLTGKGLSSLFAFDPYEDGRFVIFDRIARVYASVSKRAWQQTQAESPLCSDVEWLMSCAERAESLAKTEQATSGSMLAAQNLRNAANEYVKANALFAEVYVSDILEAGSNQLPANLMAGLDNAPIGVVRENTNPANDANTTGTTLRSLEAFFRSFMPGFAAVDVQTDLRADGATGRPTATEMAAALEGNEDLTRRFMQIWEQLQMLRLDGGAELDHEEGDQDDE